LGEHRIAITTAQIIFTCAGGLQIFENQRWLLVSGHTGPKGLDSDHRPGPSATGDPGVVMDPESLPVASSRRSFFEELYLTVITVTCVG
jgi:hypothetical protein